MPNQIQPITIPPVDTVEALRQATEVLLNQIVLDVNTVLAQPGTPAPTPTPSSSSPSTGSRGQSSFRVNPLSGKVQGKHGQNVGTSDTPKFSKVGLGTMAAAAPTYALDTRLTSSLTGWHLCDSDSDTGTYVSNSTTATRISNGAHFDGANWIAKSVQATILVLRATGLAVFYNSGLTVGSSYSPTQVLTIDGSGNVVASGDVSGGGTTMAALLSALSGKAAHGTYPVVAGAVTI